MACASLRLCLILCCFFGLSACATYWANRDDVAGRIDSWTTEAEYGLALDTLALIKPDHPDYPRLKAKEIEIRRAADEWERKLQNQAETLRRQGDWYATEQVYAEGLRKWPESKLLKESAQQFHIWRAEYLDALQQELLQLRSQYLPLEIAALEKLHALTPSDAQQKNEIQAERKLLAETRQDLIACGDQAMTRNAVETAEKCYRLAHGIEPDEHLAALLEKLQKPRQDAAQTYIDKATAATQQQQKQREQEQKRAEEERLRRLQQELETLNKRHDQAIIKADLLAARTYLEQMLQLQPDNREFRNRLQRLDNRIKGQVQNGLEQGNQYYTQGEYERAKQTWEAALRLDPNNAELKQNLARVEKVLEKLRKLKEQPGSS